MAQPNKQGGPSGAKVYDNQYQAAKAQVTPDEIDDYKIYQIIHPGTSHTAIGTAPVGTSSTSQTYVITNIRPDYPRNLLFDLSGSNDIGGTCTVVGYDQFGNSITEAIGFGTKVSPGTQASGSMIFARVTSATMTFAVGSAGSGTPVLGYSNVAGTAGVGTALGCRFGLPTKIAGTADVVLLTWDNNTTTTALNGGSIGAFIGPGGTANNAHYFVGTAAPALTSTYTVWINSHFDNSGQFTRMSELLGTP